MKKLVAAATALALALGCLALPAGYAESSVLSAFAISYDDLIEDSVSCFEYETLSADDNTIEITGYTGSGGKVVIPEEIDGKKVISIRDNAFAGEWNDETQQTGSDIKSVVISEGVERIGSYAFSGCCELTEVAVPQSVKTIGAYAFENTPWLEALKNEAPLVTINGIVIDASACAGEIIIPDNVTSIADYAFKDCKELTGAVIPESVTDIGSHAFSGCEKLESITLPDGLEEIGAKTFSDCVSLKSIDIPSSVKRIGNMAFSGCKSLSEIILPEGVTEIGAYAFVDTTAVTAVSIPASVTEIGERALGFYTQYDESIYDYSYYYLDGFELEVFYDTAGEEYAKTYRFKHSVSYLPHTHEYSSEIVREPSCTEEGTILFTCSCGDTYELAIQPTGHSAVLESAVMPTCTAIGKTEGVYCYICGEVLKAPEPVPATGHKYSALWTVDKAATCTATGLRSRHCTVCNAKTDVTVIPKKAHTYKITVVAPTYEEQGYTLHKCSVCGSSY
ncbi:MAG: leucine-rich repeat domain-containing protein, partial [Oscillospiraceae bacterium]